MKDEQLTLEQILRIAKEIPTWMGEEKNPEVSWYGKVGSRISIEKRASYSGEKPTNNLVLKNSYFGMIGFEGGGVEIQVSRKRAEPIARLKKEGHIPSNATDIYSVEATGSGAGNKKVPLCNYKSDPHVTDDDTFAAMSIWELANAKYILWNAEYISKWTLDRTTQNKGNALAAAESFIKKKLS